MILVTPDRRELSRVCHINMLKPYYYRDTPKAPACEVAPPLAEVNDNACSLTLHT